MATPFDEVSVDLCLELGIDILKLARSDLNDWILIEKIALAKKPLTVSPASTFQCRLVKFWCNLAPACAT